MGKQAAKKRLCIYCRMFLYLGVLQSSLYLVDMRKGSRPRREMQHLKKTQKAFSVKKYGVYILAQVYITDF